MIYILLVLFILFTEILFHVVDKKIIIFKKVDSHAISLTIIFVAMALVCGLRSTSVGADTRNYERIFYRISDYNFHEIFSNYRYNYIEIGWNIVNKLAYMMHLDYFAFQIIESFLIYFGFMIFIRKNVKEYNLAVWVFLSLIYFYNFNTSRQMVAVMFAVNSFQYLCERKTFKAFIMVAIGVLFHATAFVFLAAFPIYYMCKIKRLRKYLLVLIVIAILWYNDVLNFLKTNLVYIRMFFESYLSNSLKIQTAGFVRILWAVVCIMAIYELIADKSEDRQKNNVAAIFSISWVACNIIGLSFNYFERVGVYFEPFVIILFDNMLTLIKDKIIKTVYYIGSVLCLIAYFILASRSDQLISYSFFFKI